MTSRSTFLASAVLLLLTTLAAAEVRMFRRATPAKTPSTGTVAKLARSSNTFGFDLYGRLRREPGNLVISPASITTALAMTWGGAGGRRRRRWARSSIWKGRRTR